MNLYAACAQGCYASASAKNNQSRRAPAPRLFLTTTRIQAPCAWTAGQPAALRPGKGLPVSSVNLSAGNARNSAGSEQRQRPSGEERAHGKWGSPDGTEPKRKVECRCSRCRSWQRYRDWRRIWRQHRRRSSPCGQMQPAPQHAVSAGSSCELQRLWPSRRLSPTRLGRSTPTRPKPLHLEGDATVKARLMADGTVLGGGADAWAGAWAGPVRAQRRVPAGHSRFKPADRQILPPMEPPVDFPPVLADSPFPHQLNSCTRDNCEAAHALQSR